MTRRRILRGGCGGLGVGQWGANVQECKAAVSDVPTSREAPECRQPGSRIRQTADEGRRAPRLRYGRFRGSIRSALGSLQPTRRRRASAISGPFVGQERKDKKRAAPECGPATERSLTELV